MQPDQPFELDTKQEQAFEKVLKSGVYHTMHAEGFLSDVQLAALLKRLGTEKRRRNTEY